MSFYRELSAYFPIPGRQTVPRPPDVDQPTPPASPKPERQQSMTDPLSRALAALSKETSGYWENTPFHSSKCQPALMPAPFGGVDDEYSPFEYAIRQPQDAASTSAPPSAFSIQPQQPNSQLMLDAQRDLDMLNLGVSWTFRIYLLLFTNCLFF